MHKTSVSKELVQIQQKILWCKFEEVGKTTRLYNEVLANKDKVDKEKIDKDEVDKDEAKSHIIADLMTLVL